MPIGFVIGVPYYDSHNMYYYDGHISYRQQQPMNPIVSIIIIGIVVAIICVCCYISAKNGSGDYVDEEYTETTTTTEHFGGNNGPQAATYAPGTNPPGTALCNSGHIFAFMTTNPYPDDTSTCDNCNQVINFGYGGYHCAPCEVDLCKSCGDGRVVPAQMGMPQPGMMQQPPMMQQPGMPPMMQQPGMMQPGMMQPGMMQPGMQPGMM